MALPYPPPRDPTEVLGRRFAAFLIDALLLAVVAVIVVATASHSSLHGAPSNACSSSALNDSSLCFQISDRVWAWGSSPAARTLLLVGVAAFLDLVALQTVTGASVGKLCVGLRVVDAQGNEARFLRILGRWVFLAVDLGCFVVGLVSTLVTHPHRRVGDLACNTYVVAAASVGEPVVVPYPPPGFGEAAPGYTMGAPGHVPPGWGAPAGWSAPPSAPPPTLVTPPGTAPTTPGEWGAVARPAPLVRAPQWEAPPPDSEPVYTPVPKARADMAPQWAAPPIAPGDPETVDETETTDDATEETETTEGLITQWSPIVPLTSNSSGSALAAPFRSEPPPATRSSPSVAEWSPVVPANPPGPVVPPPEAPPPRVITPAPPPPVEEDDDVPWWDAVTDPADTDR